MIYKYIKLFLVAVCGVLLCADARAQAVNNIPAAFNNYAGNTLHEKVFVHTDKSVYLAGELLWFKAYSVDAATHKPVDLSKVVYVEVLDADNKPVLQAKIAMTDGSGAGSLYLPVNTVTGNYKLRAYTAWMKNFGPDYFFEKQLSFINPFIPPAVQTNAAAPAYDAQFFPEGGNLVAGISSKVAFKVTGTYGKGLANYSGAVVNQQNDTVARFKPLKFGIGSFTFTPQAGNSYKAIVKTDGSNPVTQLLPAVNSTGYVMQLSDDNSGHLQVKVTGNNVNGGSVYLFVHTRNQPKVLQTAVLSNNVAVFTVDGTKLGEGISHITVFNDNKQPVCERLYFKQPAKKMLVNVKADAGLYNTRKKVNLDILAKDVNGKAQVADLSLSVYRIDSLQKVDDDDIFGYLWLQSDLKGSIESAGYYLDDNAEARQAADNLMLSQGWRRFKWSEVLSGNKPAFKYLPEYNGHLVTASLKRQGQPVKDGLAYLGIPGKMVQMYAAKSDSTGQLLFNTKNFFGPGEIIVQTNSQVDSVSQIEINSPFSDKYSTWQLPAFSLSRSVKNSLDEHSVAMQALNIYSGDKLRHYIPVTDSSAFFGKPDKSYLLDNYTRFATLEEVFREYVPEVDIIKKDSSFTLKTLSKNGFLDEPPIVLVDGIPIFNTTKVIAIDPLKIYKLENIRNTYYWGPSKSGGIVSLTSYKGDLAGVEMDPNAMIIDYEGMQLQREFYAPVYDTEAQLKTRIPDFRNLLYWAPSIITGKEESSKVSFYTSDQTGRYVGLIQGISDEGDAAASYFKFEVKQ